MKHTLKIFATAGCLLVSAVTANANLIVNGSFEDPAFPAGGPTWGLYTTIPGWTSSGPKIEIGTAGTYGVTGQHGFNVMELDSTGNVSVSQNLAGPGSFILSFLYAQRSGRSSVDCSFDVLWNNSLIASFAPTSTVMALYSTSVIALAGQNTLTFQGTGTNTSYGALVDNVQLNSVPDAASTLALLGGALGLMGLVARRRN